MQDMQALYQDRINQLTKMWNHEEADYVPTVANIGTIAVGLGNSTVREMEADPKKEVELYMDINKTLYTDCYFTAGSAFGVKMAEMIGSTAHFISNDGQTIQHHQHAPMTEDDYDALIADPEKYMFNVLVPRTATALQKPYPERKQVILDFINYMGGKLAASGEIVERCINEYGRVTFSTGKFCYPSMDIIFDYLRGFEGVSVDMRRRPEKLLAAIDGLDEYASRFEGITDDMVLPEFTIYCTMAHIPTFLSPKQFMKFYAPTYTRMLHRVHKAGGKQVIFLEGVWKNKADWINDLPKDFCMGIVDQDDIYEMKKLVGDNIGLIGGMSFGDVRFGTLEQCKDAARKAVDELSVGGGYLYGSPKELLTKTDVNWDNYCQTYQFVHDYSKKN